jgi:hypothetical protein
MESGICPDSQFRLPVCPRDADEARQMVIGYRRQPCRRPAPEAPARTAHSLETVPETAHIRSAPSPAGQSNNSGKSDELPYRCHLLELWAYRASPGIWG